MKMELLLNRLSTFNEEPGTFPAWRLTFKSVMYEFGTTPQEELDLSVKYLGPESQKYARSMQTSCAGNPKRGLELLWKRLEERFGSPELIESHLKAKIAAFPDIKDNRRLYDLCDLMDEVQAAQENPSLKSLFFIYDTSAGANIFIGKLSYSLRQKWVTQAAKYKEQHRVPFPSFTFLVDFMRKLRHTCNDPAFQFADGRASNPQPHGFVRSRYSDVNTADTP
jgi:hypothetical protein